MERGTRKREKKEMKRGRAKVWAKGRRGGARVPRGRRRTGRSSEIEGDGRGVGVPRVARENAEWGYSLAETSRVPASGRDGCSVHRREPYRAVGLRVRVELHARWIPCQTSRDTIRQCERYSVVHRASP